MSIDTILKSLLERKKLYKRATEWVGEETARDLYVTPEIDGYTKRPFADTIEGLRLGEFAGTLDAFCEGGTITVSEDPFDKPPETILARVDPVEKEFWSIRVKFPENTDGIRCLGAFVGKDAFVALTWAYREDIPRGHFDDEVENVEATWVDMFGLLRPHSGDSLDDYLSIYHTP